MEQQQISKIKDLDLIQHWFTLICSKRNSGKWVLTKNLVFNLYNKYAYNSIFIFSETWQFTGDYDFIPKECHFKFKNIDNQIKKILKYTEKKRKNNSSFSVLLILDDVILNKKSNVLNDLWTLGRHHLITTICSVQYCKGLIWSVIRNNLDYIFMWDIGNTQIEALYDCTWTDKNKDEFKKFITSNNNDYQFIFYNAREKLRKERLKVVKADLIKIEFF